MASIYGDAKTGQEWVDSNLKENRCWVAYVDLRCLKDHQISGSNPWRKGNLYPVCGIIKGGDTGTDVVGKLEIDKSMKTTLQKKFHTHDTYIYLKLSVFSACNLYGDIIGKNALKSNRFEAKFYPPIDQHNDMIMNLPGKYGGISIDPSEVESKIIKALKTGKKGDATKIGTAKPSGKYVSEKDNKYSNKSNNNKSQDEEKENLMIENGPKPNKQKQAKQKDTKQKISAKYEVTLNTGEVVTATITYSGTPDSKVTKIGAKKIF